jgi:hypothetical protein
VPFRSAKSFQVFDPSVDPKCVSLTMTLFVVSHACFVLPKMNLELTILIKLTAKEILYVDAQAAFLIFIPYL